MSSQRSPQHSTSATPSSSSISTPTAPSSLSSDKKHHKIAKEAREPPHMTPSTSNDTLPDTNHTIKPGAWLPAHILENIERKSKFTEASSPISPIKRKPTAQWKANSYTPDRQDHKITFVRPAAKESLAKLRQQLTPRSASAAPFPGSNAKFLVRDTQYAAKLPLLPRLKTNMKSHLQTLVFGHAPSPLTPEGWVIRPDLLFGMQISGQGGTGEQVLKRMKGGKEDQEHGRVRGVHPLRSNPSECAAGVGPMSERGDLERSSRKETRKAGAAKGRKGWAEAKTFGEMEALWYR